ncbi:hypothetical protein [Streptomyces mangrovisoli]|uniref:hypothetical protein n=1 Tax=Streptomyces mangrovisoli TaxID=1428628 RepID=UPI000A92E87E|nr:hypothetical protein [Streptomyces mangrovisoli]
MTPSPTVLGRRRTFVPGPAESVPLAPPPQLPDPPIYRDLMRTWADHGRALPGRHDPEWVRLAAPPVLRIGDIDEQRPIAGNWSEPLTKMV